MLGCRPLLCRKELRGCWCRRAITTATRQNQPAASLKLLPPAAFSCGASPMAARKARMRLLRAPGRRSHRPLGLSRADGARLPQDIKRRHRPRELTRHPRQRGTMVLGANAPAATAAHAAARRIAPLAAALPLDRAFLPRVCGLIDYSIEALRCTIARCSCTDLSDRGNANDLNTALRAVMGDDESSTPR